MDHNIVEIRNMNKKHPKGSEQVVILQNLNLSIKKGEFIAIMGPSGSGKTTLLNVIAGIESLDSGKAMIAGQDISTLSDSELSSWRAQNVSIIFQSYNLMPFLNTTDNVRLPLLLTKLNQQEQNKRVAIALDLVSLADKGKFYPRELSGGQEQRVAIARAIVSDPQILLCDEPTGNLDHKTASEIMVLLKTLCEKQGKTIIMVTHDNNAAKYATRIFDMDKDIHQLTEKNQPVFELNSQREIS